MGIILIIAVAASSASTLIRRGEIIFFKEKRIEENKAEEIISGEKGVDMLIDGAMITKYEKRSEFIVNINTASELDMIRLLPEIGVNRAAAIVQYRELSGGFSSVEELCEVEGIGERLMETLRPYCTIEGPDVQYAGPKEKSEENDLSE